MLQDSQREGQLVHSSQQMSVYQRQIGRLRWWHPHILRQYSTDRTYLDWTDKVLVDLARCRFVLVAMTPTGVRSVPCHLPNTLGPIAPTHSPHLN